MTLSEQISDVFTWLHDGTITSCKAKGNCYCFTIDCAYIAELLNPAFDFLHVEIFNVELLLFAPWLPEGDTVDQNIAFEDVFLYEPEIEVSNEKNDEITLVLRIDDKDAPYPGANVTFQTTGISIFDQDKQEIGLEDFFRLVQSYWEKFCKK